MKKKSSKNPALTQRETEYRRISAIMNPVILVLSVILIAWISIDTFNQTDFLTNRPYMLFQLFVCAVFMADFFLGMVYAGNKWRYFLHRILFFILSIPFLNIVNALQIDLGPDATFFARFIPLARGALALCIVLGYISQNVITNIFVSYLTIALFVVYFGSLIFYQREAPVNPEVHSYWSALWWACMNMSTVGCRIPAVTVSGKIIEVILPVTGMIIFPLFTVYLTDLISRIRKGKY